MMAREVRYTRFDIDMVSNARQQYSLPEGYRWIREEPWAKVLYRVSYPFYWTIAQVYLRLVKGVRFKGRRVLRCLGRGQGAFVYGNHTMTTGDALTPVLCKPWRRNWAVCSPANFGIPVLGPLLRWFGALPTADSLSELAEMSEAVRRRALSGGVVTIYPEAHLWPYCTFVRPLTEAAFHYPVATGLPSFVAVTTYTRRKVGKKPKITIYYDGPFYPRPDLPVRERRRSLASDVGAAMERYARLSNCEYIKYIKDETE